MATAALIPVSEYLKTTYRPDCDYIDGEVRERYLGEKPHSGLQGFFFAYFLSRKLVWGLRPYTEQRVQVKPTRFRVPDVCAETLPASPDPILRTPPFICIEVLSPEDTLSDMEERVADYLSMGVEHVWLFDPVRRHAWTATPAGFLKLTGDAFAVPGTLIRVPLAEINAELDEIAAGR
jgi:Uma2 family endonuclease